jgi:hypothetical protein
LYTGIVSILAGFSVASAIFIAGLEPGQESGAFTAAVGMLLVSFLTLIGSAMMYSDTPTFPSAADDPAAVFQSISNVFANASYFLGLALGWLALRPLLELIGFVFLADAFTWLLLATVVAGSARLAVFVYRLTAARGAACLAIPIVGIGLPALYRLVVVPRWPELWPATDTALWFAFVAFAVNSAGYLHQTALFIVHGSARVEQELRRNAHRVALASLQVTSMSAALVWFAVAMG